MPFPSALLDRLERAVRRYGAGTPTDRVELASAISPLGVGLDQDYAEFVERFGGCYVGVPVYGLRNSDLLEDVSVVDLTLRFRGGPYQSSVCWSSSAANPWASSYARPASWS